MFLKILFQLLKLLNGKNAAYVVLLSICFMLANFVFTITNKIHNENNDLVKKIYDKSGYVAKGINVDAIGDDKTPISAISE